MTDWVTEPAPGEEKIPSTPPLQRWSTDHAGVVIDSVHGWRALVFMVNYAASCGWYVSAKDAELIHHAVVNELSDREVQHWQDLCDEVMDWMNDHLAPEEFQFGWIDGDFMLQSKEWWCAKLSPGVCDDPGHTHSLTP